MNFQIESAEAFLLVDFIINLYIAGVFAFASFTFPTIASPIQGMYVAVTRQTLDNNNSDGWVPAEKITVELALNANTETAAYASFYEHFTGPLEVEKLANFVILNDNLLKDGALKNQRHTLLEKWYLRNRS